MITFRLNGNQIMSKQTSRQVRASTWVFCVLIAAGASGLKYYGQLADVYYFSLIGLCILVVSGVELKTLSDQIDSIGLDGIDFRGGDDE